MTDLVPYTFQTPALPAPERQTRLKKPGYYGVHFTFEQEHADFLQDKIAAWFRDRSEIILVDHGECRKTDLAFLVLEWDNCQIDPLFLRILQHEEMIDDYSTYFRAQEDYN